MLLLKTFIKIYNIMYLSRINKEKRNPPFRNEVHNLIKTLDKVHVYLQLYAKYVLEVVGINVKLTHECLTRKRTYTIERGIGITITGLIPKPLFVTPKLMPVFQCHMPWSLFYVQSFLISGDCLNFLFIR